MLCSVAVATGLSTGLRSAETELLEVLCSVAVATGLGAGLRSAEASEEIARLGVGAWPCNGKVAGTDAGPPRRGSLSVDTDGNNGVARAAPR